MPCNGTQALHFPAFDGRDYWLEYRTPQALDEGLDGVLLHVSGQGGGSPDPYILDFEGDRIMVEGDSYTDPMGEVTFTVVSIDATHAVIDLQFPDGGSGSPTCLGGSSP